MRATVQRLRLLPPLYAIVTLSATWAGAQPLPEPAAVALAIPNRGFEDDADGDGMPDGWSFAWEATHQGDRERGIEKQRPDFGLDTRVCHSGARSVRVGVERAVDDGVWSTEMLDHLPGAKYYKVTAWIKTEGLQDSDARVAVICHGADGNWLGANYGAIVAATNRDWTQYTGYAECPPGTAKVRLRLWMNFNYTGTGTAWFDDIAMAPTDHIEPTRIEYVDNTPMPRVTADEQRRGYVLFSRSYLRLIFPNTVPIATEKVASLSLRACRGEREPVVLAVRALRALRGVKVAVSGLRGEGGATIPAASADVRRVRYLERQGQSRWGPFADGLMTVPQYLARRGAIDVPAETCQPYWLTVHVPENARVGRYRGEVTVSADNAETASVPLEVEVLPFTLSPPPGVHFGMYSKFWETPGYLDTIYADMRDHGMTTVGLSTALGAELTMQDGAAHVAWDGNSRLERAMAAYVKAGFTEPVLWLMGRDVAALCLKQGELESDTFATCYRQIIEQILARGKQLGWPEIIFQPVDEPFEHTDRMPLARRCLQILKQIPGVRTEEDGHNGRPEMLDDETYQLCDVLAMHDGPVTVRRTYDAEKWQAFLEKARRDGKQLWFYNIDLTGWHPEPLRFMYGFGLWQSGGPDPAGAARPDRRARVATGVIQWCYQVGVPEDDPGRAYRNPGSLLYYYPPTDDEPGGPCIAWEAIREGVDDYKYLHRLHTLVERAKESGSAEAATTAERLWSHVEGKLAGIDFGACEGSAAQGDWTGDKDIAPDGRRLVSGDHKIANGWSFDDYDALRKHIADGIVTLERIGVR